MAKSHTLTITLSCEDDQKEALSTAMNTIIKSAVDQAMASKLNIDKLASTPGPDLTTTLVYRGGTVLDGGAIPVTTALYNKEIKAGAVEAEDITVGEGTPMAEEEARKSLMDSIERSLNTPSMESHK